MSEKKVLIDNKPVPIEDTKVVFGAYNGPTPKWVKVTISLTTRVTAAFALYMAATNLIPEAYKYELMVAIKALDFLVVEVGKFLGMVEK